MLAAIDREYERRIDAASLIVEPYAAVPGPPADDAAEEAAIINLPRGTRFPRPAANPPEQDRPLP
jgi:hypothetical protein